MTFARPATTDPQTIGAAALCYVLAHGHTAELTEADLRHAAAAAIVARMPRELDPVALDRLNTAAERIARAQIRRAAVLEAFARSGDSHEAEPAADGQPAAPDAPPETDAELCLKALRALLAVAGRPPSHDDDHPGGGARVPRQPRPQAPGPATALRPPTTPAPGLPAPPPTEKPAPADFQF